MTTVLFPGRFQPFHLGHLYTIKKILGNNHKVVIALRDTPINGENPFSLTERRRIITQSLNEAQIDINRYRIVRIPDICDQWVKKIERLVNFDILCTGNDQIKKAFEKSHYPIIYISRTKSGYYSGTKIRERLSKNSSILAFTYPQTSRLIYRLFKRKHL